MSYRLIAAAALALAPLAAAAQATAKTEPASAKAGALAYESAFTGYRPHADTGLVPWREVNDEMARLNGHVGHLKPEMAVGETTAPAPGTAPKPPMHGGHAGHGARK